MDALEESDSKSIQHTRTLARYHRRLRHLLSELVLTEQREKRRIAGELHDHLAQLLVACKMKLALAKSSVAGGDAVALLEEVDGFLNESLTYTRNLVAQISPVLLYEQGLLPALRWLAEAVMPRHGLEVTLDERTDLAQTSLAEDARVLLFHCVRELLFNVVKHARADTATLTVRQRDGGVELAVADEGVGFELERVRNSGGDVPRGFGLLSIHERMAMLGGRFDLDSSPAHGTRATMWVPGQATSGVGIVTASSAEAAIADEDTQAAAASEHIRVLVVDDHAVVREGLLMMLAKEDDLVVVGEAENGSTALELVPRLRPRVVLMDVGLPGIDGIETTRRLTAAHKDVKVVGLSMHEDESTAAAMRDAGAVDYLCKGCSPELLIASIRRAAQGQLTGSALAASG